MNSNELLNILLGDNFTCLLNPSVKPWNHFIENKLEKPSMTIVNLDVCSQSGSHWVGVYVPLYGSIEYFDSYGVTPKKHLVDKILELNQQVIYSSYIFQGFSTVCGQYSLIYLLLRSRNYSFKEVINLFHLCDTSDERDLIINHIINNNFKNILQKKLKVIDEDFLQFKL